ncbi:hypothetical protein E3983_03750 [Legionella israelensis]|uniref:chitinase n=1 Tax=Legionella israelensis TaxID=454 RepID=A0AAX1EJG5_9GAMM|nr:glycosyl hydrolase family 18 protein [Legionella israelensis]QBR85301.1 hypothetical protein E3983_03750 [Legionella israelensis]
MPAIILLIIVGGTCSAQNHSVSPTHIQPTSCIQASFTSSGTPHWQSIFLKLTNNCTKPADFQNATIKFDSTSPLNTNFWGDFSPLSYPDNELLITSQVKPNGNYEATLSLHFPNYPGANSILPVGSSFLIKYGATKDNHIEGTTNVFLNAPISTGNIVLQNISEKPSNVSQGYALVHLLFNNQVINDVQVPWNGSKTVFGLTPGNYQVSVETVFDNSGNRFEGKADPSSVEVMENQTSNTTISYQAKQELGKIRIRLQSLPAELSGYSLSPSVLVTQEQTGNAQSYSLAWDNELLIDQLMEGRDYHFSTPVIKYNGYNCNPGFSPSSLTANATNVPVTDLTYQCIQVNNSLITLNVSGAPSELASLTIQFTPNDGSQPVTQTIALSNGSGSSTILLTEGVIYTLSAELIQGYTLQFSPQPLTAADNGVEIITFTPITSTDRRIIGYIPGWKTPPAAQSLADAGYTHAMIAFGVFSTSVPGEIVPAFHTITKEYVQSLHDAGIKVILSLGGALTSIPNTSVDFHQVLSTASSETAFKQTFMNSLNGLISEYQFDGFDIDIEHGLNGGGTFSQPQGDVAVLASIINTMHSQNQSLLITLTPQVANIAATSGFDGTWGNYAALTMQVHDSIEWVGIQLYNTGCAFGIDLICYGPTPTTTPDFTVAMATDLLENWPSMVNGRNTGFQPYISYLNPGQVVIGYPSPNASGQSDGSPVTPTSTIKKALQCLSSHVNCDTYIPPRAYGNIGGVFNWEVTYDQQNNFNFAKDLKACVTKGNCN